MYLAGDTSTKNSLTLGGRGMALDRLFPCLEYYVTNAGSIFINNEQFSNEYPPIHTISLMHFFSTIFIILLEEFTCKKLLL